MERDYNNEDFEYFLKQKADQYKLYPSDKVWRGINSHLHPKTRWFTIGGGLLLITGLFFLSQHIISSQPNVKVTSDVSFITASRSEAKELPLGSAVPVLNLPSANQKNSKVQKAYAGSFAANKLKKQGNLPENTIVSDPVAKTGVMVPSVVKAIKLPAAEINTVLPLPDIATQAGKEWAAPETSAVDEIKQIGPKEINWLEELAAIKLTPRKRNLFDIQFYFSPTITYRRLADNKEGVHSNQQNVPLTANSLNIDRYVDHKPSFGAELGTNVLFNASRNLTIKTGVQLNYSRYSIKAYKFYFEKASIALNTAGPIADTIRAFTSIRNFNGYSPEELQNQYLQLSLPIGAELKLLGNKRLQLNIAGTIQPNYLLFNDTYLLSTDYVNYAKEASLVRKWNVNTSLEAFLSYKVGGLRWQVGPQFRYQLMSSYIDRYPIKEYLMEYGVKIGVSKTLR